MALMTARERGLAAAISRLVHANPFPPERIEAEREALGADFKASRPVWSARTAHEEDSPNLPALDARAQALADALRQRLSTGVAPRADEPARAFALFFQIRRAFHFTFSHMRGASASTAAP